MQFNRKWKYGIISIVVVVIVITAGLTIYQNQSKGSNEVVLSKYIKISNSDLLSVMVRATSISYPGTAVQ